MRRLLLLLALIAFAPRVASAHATLVRSTPAAGSHLAAPPARLLLVFSEEIEPKLARVSVVGSNGSERDIAVHADPHDVNALVGSLDSLPDGAYRLVWRIVSADGHPVDGSFVFSVGANANAPPAPPANEEVARASADIPYAAALWRGLGIGFLMTLCGLLIFRRSAPNSLSAASVRRSDRVANAVSLLAAVFCVAHFVAWLAHISPSHSLDAESFAAVTSSRVGTLELWRTGLAILAPWALLLARRRTLALLAAGAAVVLSGVIGHSAAIIPLVTAPAKILHLVGGAVWLGGVVWLLCIAGSDMTLIGEARRVSSAALIAVVTVAVSGTVQAVLFLPSVLDVVRTSYGLLVLAKAVGLLILIAFGAQHRFRSLPRLEDDIAASRPFHRSLAREVMVMTLVIILGGVLSYVPPAAHSMGAPGESSLSMKHTEAHS